jgi:hypothetical protein
MSDGQSFFGQVSLCEATKRALRQHEIILTGVQDGSGLGRHTREAHLFQTVWFDRAASSSTISWLTE